MAGGVNEVELAGAAVLGGVCEADGLGFDGDAALALEFHAVQELVDHLAVVHRAGVLH